MCTRTQQRTLRYQNTTHVVRAVGYDRDAATALRRRSCRKVFSLSPGLFRPNMSIHSVGRSFLHFGSSRVRRKLTVHPGNDRGSVGVPFFGCRQLLTLFRFSPQQRTARLETFQHPASTSSAPCANPSPLPHSLLSNPSVFAYRRRPRNPSSAVNASSDCKLLTFLLPVLSLTRSLRSSSPLFHSTFPSKAHFSQNN